MDITQFNVQKSQQYMNKYKQDSNKTAGGSYTATGSEITEKEQLLCNTHLSIICYMIIPFYQPGIRR